MRKSKPIKLSNEDIIKQLNDTIDSQKADLEFYRNRADELNKELTARNREEFLKEEENALKAVIIAMAKERYLNGNN